LKDAWIWLPSIESTLDRCSSSCVSARKHCIGRGRDNKRKGNSKVAGLCHTNWFGDAALDEPGWSIPVRDVHHLFQLLTAAAVRLTNARAGSLSRAMFSYESSRLSPVSLVYHCHEVWHSAIAITLIGKRCHILSYQIKWNFHMSQLRSRFNWVELAKALFFVDALLFVYLLKGLWCF
jgi:hypothetical protein